MLFGRLLVTSGTSALLVAAYGALTQAPHGRHHWQETQDMRRPRSLEARLLAAPTIDAPPGDSASAPTPAGPVRTTPPTDYRAFETPDVEPTR
jgi:hypothetical protein